MHMNRDLTISEALGRVEEQMTIANLAENTRKSYRGEIRRFFEHVGKMPGEVEAGDVRGWILSGIRKGLKPGSVNIAAAAMRFLFRDALDCPDLVKGIRNQVVPRRLPRHMKLEEIERLTLAITDIRYRAATILSYSSGLRISEAVDVKVQDIDGRKNLLHIRSGKGGTERMAPMPPKVVDYLRGYHRSIHPRPRSWMFYANTPDRPISTESLRNAFNAALAKADLNPEYTFHCLRHSFAAHVHEQGGSIDVLQDALGHRHSDTTRAYARATGAMFARLSHPISGSTVIRA